jgi:colanic acid biosynthesis glycosyl transferase WcaI
MPRVIFINRYFFPDESATSQMLSDLAFGLSSQGSNVTVIASRQRYDDAGAHLPKHETRDGVDIHRVWTTSFGRHSLAGRFIDYMTFYVAAAWALLRMARVHDIIVAMTDPPMLSAIAAPIALWRGAKLVNWVQDLFPEIAEAIGLDRRQLPHFVYDFLRRVRNSSLRCAAANVAIGAQMKKRLVAQSVAAERIAVIGNWIDAELVKPVPPAKNSLRREWGLDGEFVVGYSGNLGRAHDYRTILEAIRLLGAKRIGDANIKWLLVGRGALYEAFASEISKEALQSVVFKPYQPRELLTESLSAFDVHLVSLRPELEGLIVPSKIYGIAAAGRPAIFIGDKDGELARLIQGRGLGYVTAQGDGAGLAALVLAIARDQRLRHSISARARKVCEQEFTKKMALERWGSLLSGFT